jgi:hypothetical protein
MGFLPLAGAGLEPHRGTITVMLTRTALGCTLAVAALIVPASAQSDIAGSFWTPSKNIRCVAERNPQPPINWALSCQVVSTRSQVTMAARGAPVRVPYTFFSTRLLSFATLAYGARMVIGPFVCRSRPDGLTCTNTTGGGWALSRSKVRLLGPMDESVHVLDYSGSCNTVRGCLRVQPRTWAPDRTPRGGVGVVFQRLAWRFWGHREARATGSARVCTSNPTECTSHQVAFKVYSIGQHDFPRGRIYGCMYLSEGPPEIVGVPIQIDGSTSPRRC